MSARAGTVRAPRPVAARILFWFGACVACAACSRGGATRPGTPPKHVLLVTASSVRADHMSAYLYRRPTTAWPALEEDRMAGRDVALDDLASQGVLFANAFSPTSRTLPALAALLTGRATPVVAGEAALGGLGEGEKTLAECFQAAGFQTAAFMSGLPLREPEHGLERGFEVLDYRFGDTQILKLAIDWMRARHGLEERPLFLWVHLSGADPPHDPRPLPPRPGGDPGAFDFGRYFDDPEYDGPARGDLAFLAQIESGEFEPSKADYQHLVDLYDGELARLASGLRTFVLSIIELDEGELWRDSLFVFAGTHGIELGDNGPVYSAEGSLHADVLRVPLIFRHRNSLTGSRVLSELVGLEDVAPTVCEWFGLELGPPRVPGTGERAGRTLLAVMDSYVRRAFESRPAWALERDGSATSAATRTPDWTLLRTPAASGPEGVFEDRLFDRLRDPGERVDLASQRPVELARMRALLEQQLAAWKTPD